MRQQFISTTNYDKDYPLTTTPTTTTSAIEKAKQSASNVTKKQPKLSPAKTDSFQAKKAASPAQTAPSKSEGIPLWEAGLGAIVLIAVGGATTFFAGKHGRS